MASTAFVEMICSRHQGRKKASFGLGQSDKALGQAKINEKIEAQGGDCEHMGFIYQLFMGCELGLFLQDGWTRNKVY